MVNPFCQGGAGAIGLSRISGGLKMLGMWVTPSICCFGPLVVQRFSGRFSSEADVTRSPWRARTTAAFAGHLV
jgi:hypothetical protein